MSVFERIGYALLRIVFVGAFIAFGVYIVVGPFVGWK